ncbi:hypothetical protein SBON0123_004147 [Salmonella bongori serovar 40:z35:- str. 95-0123]|nr:hypothetical protein [Salmonella bongori serovar 40:z35:- str. 95-0123]
MLSEQPPACAGYPPDRPDPPRYRFMFSLWVKWPEKAVSESSHELAQLSCLVQFYGHAAAKPAVFANRSP